MPPYSFLLPLRTVSRHALFARSYQTGVLLQQTRWISQGRRPLKNARKKSDLPISSRREDASVSEAPEPLTKILDEIHVHTPKTSSSQHANAAAAAPKSTETPNRKAEEHTAATPQTSSAPKASQQTPAGGKTEAAASSAPATPQANGASPSPSSSTAHVDGEAQAPVGAAPTAPPVPAPKPHAENIVYRLFASWQQGLVASIGAMMGIGFLFFLFYNPVKEDTVHHTAVVASEALNDLRLRNQAVQLSKDVVDNVLKDPKSLDLVCELVVQLLAKEDTKIAVSSLLQSLFEDHYTQEVTKKFVLTIVRDPWIQDQLHIIFKEQVTNLLQDDDVKQALTKLLITSAADSLEDPQLHFRASRAIRGWTDTAFNATLASVAVVCASYAAYAIRAGKP